MFRLLLRFLVLLVVIGLVRYVVAVVARTIAQVMHPQATPAPGNQAAAGIRGGELKQDPVCGTFVATTTSVKKSVNGEVVHFCSVACRDKYKVA